MYWTVFLKRVFCVPTMLLCTLTDAGRELFALAFVVVFVSVYVSTIGGCVRPVVGLTRSTPFLNAQGSCTLLSSWITLAWLATSSDFIFFFHFVSFFSNFLVSYIIFVCVNFSLCEYFCSFTIFSSSVSRIFSSFTSPII